MPELFFFVEQVTNTDSVLTVTHIIHSCISGMLIISSWVALFIVLIRCCDATNIWEGNNDILRLNTNAFIMTICIMRWLAYSVCVSPFALWLLDFSVFKKLTICVKTSVYESCIWILKYIVCLSLKITWCKCSVKFSVFLNLLMNLSSISQVVCRRYSLIFRIKVS